MAGNITPEMVALLNSGNKAELRAFLKLYTRPVYERALAITKNEADAIRVTRRVTSEVSVLALRGKLENDIDAQLMALTDACCSEDLFFARLVEDTLRDYPEDYSNKPVVFSKAASPNWPKRRSAVERGSAAVMNAVKEEAPQTCADVQQKNDQPKKENAAPKLFDEDLSESWDDWDDEWDDGISPDEEADTKPSVLIVLLIFLLAMVTLALVWVLVVKLMYMGILPKADFGFAEWFNKHLFMLY